MSTRTSIHFGAILEAIRKERLPDFEQVIHESTHSNLLYGYRKVLDQDFHGYLLVQTSRQYGRLACEVAVTRLDAYPFHRFYDRPRLGLSGFRERIYRINRGKDELTTYAGPENVAPALMRLVGQDAEVALERLKELVIPTVNKEYALWLPIYRDWLEAEKTGVTGDPGSRYPALPGEATAHGVLHEALTNGSFDRYLGPLKFRYRDVGFLNCHIFVLARALEFLEPPLIEDSHRAAEDEEPRDDAPLDDASPALTGRHPQLESVTWASSSSVQTLQYAFLKSLAAVVSFYSADPPEEQVLPELPQQMVPPRRRPAPQELLYDGIYDAPEYEEPPRNTPEPEPPPTTQVDRDPFDLLGDALG